MADKRGDQVPPPRPLSDPQPADVWELRFENSQAAKGWAELRREADGPTWEAWIILTQRPIDPENRRRQYRLRGGLSTVLHQGKTLDQWQYKVTGSGRIWYCADPDTRTVWMYYASTKHPKQTEK